VNQRPHGARGARNDDSRSPHWPIIDSNGPLGSGYWSVVGAYNGWLVGISVVVAIVSSYVALDLASRVTASRGRRTALWWLTGGAVSMGSGIWSMHFIGMLALILPTPMSYDPGITLVSLALPIFVSAFALRSVSGKSVSGGRLLVGGIVLGIGIVSMHFLGMMAMRVEPPLRYQLPLVIAAILIAVAASIGGLWSALRLRMETILTAFWKKAGSAVVMGAGIAGMHYTGMAAAISPHVSIHEIPDHGLDPVWLAVTVSILSLGFLLGTMLLSAFDAYLFERASHHAIELERRVEERTSALARANQRLVEVEEAERRHIARELHDRVGQELTALGINLRIIKSQLSKDERAGLDSRLEDSIVLVESTMSTVEDVLAELHPPMLEEHGLLAALECYAQEFEARTGIRVALSDESEAGRPPLQIALAAFRIAQEALNNIAKHARATQVEIELTYAPDEVMLSISDNGIGFDARANHDDRNRPGRGLGLMQERAQSIGARLEIRTALGKGTRITIGIPS
jgi:NO-binding membrane sensor protein with MHYT domain/two-component sensor histidine kinase